MMNKVILLGNLGKDPEIRTLNNGGKVAQFTLATSENWKNKEGERESITQWHNIVAWKHLAETAEKFLKKGSKILIEGKITYRSWDKEDGTKAYMTEIVAQSIQLLDKKETSTTSEVAAATTTPAPVADVEDDLPF